MKKAYFKKVFLTVMSLAMALSSITAVPASAADGLVPDGYKFIDAATDGNGTYVAMAKSAEKDNYGTAYLFYSNDGGLTWQRSTDQPIASNATVYSNRKSQQQLVWWEANDIFVAHGSGTTHISSNGNNWSESADDGNHKALHWSSNEVIDVSGDRLVFAGGEEGQGPANATNSTSKWMFSENKYSFYTGRYYSQTVAAKPVDESGATHMMIAGYNMAFDLSFTVDENGKCNWKTEGMNMGGEIPTMLVDAKYAKGADQYLMIGESGDFYAAANTGKYNKIEANGGMKVTAVGVSDSYIAIGTDDGRIYYTANAPVTNDTQWTQVPVSTGSGTAEKITNIEFENDTDFVALAETEICKGDINGYFNIKDYVEIGDVTVSGAGVFGGVRLIGGTYSPSLNKYIVYGDTTAPDSENKYWGKIFLSEDGLNWRNVYTGYTFTQRNVNDETGAVSYGEVRNGAVWWESQGIFIVSASTMDHTGVTLISSDGETWHPRQPRDSVDEEGNPAPELDTDMQLNADIVVSGDKLYTTNNGRQFRTYTAWNKASMTSVALTQLPNTWYMNQIAVSNDEDPAVLMAQNEQGAVRNNESAAEDELDKWTAVNNLGNWGAMTDAVFSDSLNKFVGVFTKGYRTSIIGKDGSTARGPEAPGGVVCKAIATNGETFMFAGVDGNIYTAPDNADFANAALETVKPVTDANEYPLTNIVAAGDKFIATSTDNVNSDVMLVSKNNDGTYVYESVNAGTKLESLVPGQDVEISVSGVNNTDSDYNFTLITAIYSDGVLVQVQSDDMAITSGMAGEATAAVTLNDDLPANAEMKIYMWDSLGGMNPVKPVSSPF